MKYVEFAVLTRNDSISKKKMGVVNANVVISNPANRDRSWEGVFLVDTGATDSLVPRQHLEAIGLKPEAQRTYLLADGTEVEMDIAVARIELMGKSWEARFFLETQTPSRCSG